ncbi:MAG: hypothetical protein FalmKO_32500 [Falsiruegeria mediterranea]
MAATGELRQGRDCLLMDFAQTAFCAKRKKSPFQILTSVSASLSNGDKKTVVDFLRHGFGLVRIMRCMKPMNRSRSSCEKPTNS